MRHFFLLLLSAALHIAPTAAQVQVERSAKTVSEGEKTYYLHTVKKGETMYSICRAYGVSEAEMHQSNPILNDEVIKVDQVLKVIAKAATPAITTANAANSNTRPAGRTYHITKEGETLYSIARQYRITVDDILAVNPEVDKVLSVGVVLNIPADTVPATPSINHNEHIKVVEHIVQRKETLFSISNIYEVDINAIKLYNPRYFATGKERLKVGQALNIPLMLSGVKKGTATHTNIATSKECDNIQRNKTPFNVVLLAPFNADQQDNPDELHRSFRFLEMYEGAMLALDELRKQGASFVLTVVDTKFTDLDAILHGAALSNADLIIGPVYQEDFAPIADFALGKDTKIISPLTPIDSSLLSYSNVYQIPSTFEQQAQKLLSSDLTDVQKSNIILLSQIGNEDSRSIRNLYRQYLPHCDTFAYKNAPASKDSASLEQAKLQYECRVNAPTVKQVLYRGGLQPRDNQEMFLEVFNPNVINKVIVASEDEPFVSEVLANLKAFSDRYRCKIVVYGNNKWRKFENIELSIFYNLKLRLATPYYTDYEATPVIKFIEDYRKKYKTEPSQFAYQGHDIMLYFGTALYQYGRSFERCLPYVNVDLLQSKYNFVPLRLNGAYGNSDSFLIRYNSAMLEIFPYK
ncbi:MAG: LysM peptidoglycan-binding domain-containing protein [Prevotellaceae bacterium]|jgi:LysM repeat protein|nr:LysM peptidoglycan-binding domain-containing protein [Prevotellaceae bacterium]